MDWDALLELITSGAGTAGDWAMSGLGALGSGLGSLGTSVAQNPLATIGLGTQAAGTLMPFFMGGSPGAMPQNLQPQMMANPANAPGIKQSLVKSSMADAQAAGLSGASPDFLAAMTGLTPEELAQLMGQQGQGQQGQGY